MITVMRHILALILFISFSVGAFTSEFVSQYKASLSINSIEFGNSVERRISQYPISYPGGKYYVPPVTPKIFNKVAYTVSQHYCEPKSFEYNLILNKPIWEGMSIERKITQDFTRKGYRVAKSTDYGVNVWVNNQVKVVTFMTKVTPFSYINSTCRV